MGMTNSYGSGSNDFFVLKTNSDLSLNWSLAVGTDGGERGYGIIQTQDLGILLVGADWAGDDTGLLVKLYPNRTIEW